MSTYNTQNPLGSSSAKDLYDNAENSDHLVNDTVNETWPDRFGVRRWTWHGIEKQNDRALTKYGYITKDSFEDGATLNTANEVLRWESNGEYYRWDGTFPKVVPAGSTPAGTGGIVQGAWVGVGDASLRATLNSPDGADEVYLGDEPISFYLPLLTSRWGIDETKDKVANANRLNEMIDYAISTGRLIIDVDTFPVVDDINVPIRKKTEVFFRSKGGEIRGLYRRATVKPGAPSNVRVDNGLCQAGMAQFYRAKNPRVVIMGDSISTDGPNALANSDSMSAIILQEIVAQNPGVGIDFINRAIGGQTWAGANGTPGGGAPWYQDSTKPWLDYVKEASPDLLILAFGMNDANGFSAGSLHAVVNKIKAWDKVPSLLFVTNPVPAISTTWAENGFYQTIFQEGRDWVAGYERSYANRNGYSVLDINRQFCLIRDGRDYLNVPLARAGVYNQSYIYDTSLIARDFTISGDIATWPLDKVLLLKVGGGELDTVTIQNSGGFYRVQAFCTGDQTSAGVAPPYVALTTTVPVTTGQTLAISVQNNTFTLFAGTTRVITFPIIRFGGELSVLASWQGSTNSGPFVSVTVNVGNWLQCEYTARDSDIWGHDDGTADTKLPEGGNGINHYSSNGLALVVAPVVKAFDFRQKVIESSRAVSALLGGTTASGEVIAHRRGNEISLSGGVKRAGTGDLLQLPVGFIPESQRVVSAPVLGSSGWAMGVINISPAGVVNLSVGDGSSLISLDGITFSA